MNPPTFVVPSSILAAAGLLLTAIPAMAESSTPEANKPAADSNTLRIATVDMQELVKQYPRADEVIKQFKVDQARVQKEDQERVDKIKKVAEELNQLHKQIEETTNNDAKKQEYFKQWQSKQDEGLALERERREFQQRKSQAINENLVRQMKMLLGEIRVIVAEQAKAENYDQVFDRSSQSAAQVPIMLYAKDSTDITPSILKLLKKPEPATDAKDDKSSATEKPADKK